MFLTYRRKRINHTIKLLVYEVPLKVLPQKPHMTKNFMGFQTEGTIAITGKFQSNDCLKPRPKLDFV